MVPVRRALRLVIDGKAEVVEAEGTPVHSERMAVPRPAVIRLVRFVHVPRRFRRQVTNTTTAASSVAARSRSCASGSA